MLLRLFELKEVSAYPVRFCSMLERRKRDAGREEGTLKVRLRVARWNPHTS